MSSLTQDQIEFLERHNISPSRLFDASGLSRSDYQDAMKVLDIPFAYGVSACSNGGHTLKSRSGHCIQCNPARIAYMLRSDSTAEVYVAHSPRRHLTKVGVSADPTERLRNLNSHQYGRVDDWKLFFRTKCKQAGKVEFEAHKALRKHHVVREYVTGGESINCIELFDCSPELAVSTLQNVVAKWPPNRER